MSSVDSRAPTNSLPGIDEAVPERQPLSAKGESLLNYQYDTVLGCPRSGTTFLMTVLNSIPDIECVSGTILPVSIPHIVNASISPEVFDALAVGFERALDDYMESGRFRSRAAALQKWVRAPTGLSGLWDAIRAKRSISRIVYKEPFLSFAPEFVYYALPGAKIIHLVRDGRDCANSLRRNYDVLTDEHLTHLLGAEMRLGRKVDDRYVPWWIEADRENEFLQATSYGRAAWMWSYMVGRCDDFFSQPEVEQSGRVLTLRYEDFVRDPQTWGARILDHLELSPNRWFRRRLDAAHTDSIGKHTKRPRREIDEAERIAGKELRRFGYL